MAGGIDKSNRASHDGKVYRVPQPAPVRPEQKGQKQQEARSSYSFQDSRHVYKGGHAEVTLDLAVEEASAEKIELLGFLPGDWLKLDGVGSISGTARIMTLTDDRLDVHFELSVPPSALRAAATVFARLAEQPYALDEGLARLRACVSKDEKGGYRYSLFDVNQQDKLLRAAPVDLRIDDFSTWNRLHQVLTFIVESGSTISFAVESASDAEPHGTLKVSLAPGMGEFEVTRQDSR